jgi:hypothetical protein
VPGRVIEEEKKTDRVGTAGKGKRRKAKDLESTEEIGTETV